jgi:hypothetical protein
MWTIECFEFAVTSSTWDVTSLKMKLSRQPFLAKLKCESASRATRIAAFLPDIPYLDIGLCLLNPSCCWSEHYELSLNLLTSMAEMCSCAGQMDKCEVSVKEVVVLAHSKLIDDSIHAHLIWM